MHLQNCSLRFSILSPHTVIDEAFNILNQLNSLTPITVMDTEIDNHYYMKDLANHNEDSSFHSLDASSQMVTRENRCTIAIDADLFRRNELGIAKRTQIMNNSSGQVIASGDETINAIKEQGLVEQYFGWVRNFIQR